MRKVWKNTLAVSLSACLLLSGAGCHVDKKIASAELSKGYERTSTIGARVSNAFKQGVERFSFSLFQNSFEKNANTLISPLSAAACLALINNGAVGNTRAQIEALFGVQTAELNSGFYAYASSLPSEKNCRVEIANSIWMKENALQVEPAFLQANADWYGAQAYASPFDNTTVEDINNWCYNHTKGKIDKVLDEISPYAVMYLINAVDFDAKWNTKYGRKDIEKGNFFNANGGTPDVTMLYSEESTYFEDENAVGFARPYKDGKYSFVAFLPHEEVPVADFVNSLSAEKWETLWTEKTARTVHARIPEFSYETEFTLNHTLGNMGVTDLFSPETADLSGIDKTQKLFCALVKQKSFIQLDRNGTKVASVTLAGLKAMSADPSQAVYITLDRPFVYAIVDNEHKLPLFLGTVMNL